MNSAELQTLLENLINTWENEVIEFKEASNDYRTNTIGKYFSALANEANLRGIDRSWLVFGVKNSNRTIVGTDYRPESERLHSLKMQIQQDTEPNMTFRNIHELFHADGRVVLFEIPAAPRGLPIARKGHYYARAGESLTNLSLDKLDEIRQQTLLSDWSAEIVGGATLDHLDEEAMQQAKDSFATKYANRFSEDEVADWSLQTFLDRAQITRDGDVTRTALILLGKPESAHLLQPYPAQMTWKLEGQEQAYEHFGPPFLINTSKLYSRIRNIQIRVLPEDGLFPVEMAKYDNKVVLEALHNCISHQDYSRNGRIVVTELPEKLLFENEGSFFEGQPEDYVTGGRTPRRYRNPFLARAMTELNMIDTMGYGIHAMHVSQARRYFPLPDYDLRDPGAVKVIVHGRIVDPAYSRLLMQKTDLPLSDIIALDRVQKKLPVENKRVAELRKAGMVEGRKPNIHVSASIAKTTGGKAEYIKTRAQDDAFYEKLITDYLTEFKSATREDINTLLMDKLSQGLTAKQKDTKIGHILTNMRRRGVIINKGVRKVPDWRLAE